MSNTTILETEQKHGGFGEDVISSVRQHMNKTGLSGTWREAQPAVGVTGMVKYVAGALADFSSMRSTVVPITDSDTERFLSTLVQLRCMQLSRCLPKGVFAADVPVPDFFRPVLSAICLYEAPFQALKIRPVWNPLRAAEDENTEKDDGMVTDLVMEFDELRRVSRLLKSNGIRCTDGLPRELSTSNDNVFRIREDSEGNLLVAGEDVGEVELLIRSILRIQFLHTVYGAARTRYVSVDDLRSAWESVVQTGFVQ